MPTSTMDETLEAAVDAAKKGDKKAWNMVKNAFLEGNLNKGTMEDVFSSINDANTMMLPIAGGMMVIMGKHSSGHNDSSKLEHFIKNSNTTDPGNLIVAIDVAVTSFKPKGEEWIAKLKKENDDMPVDQWSEKFKAVGSPTVMKDAKRDLFVKELNVEEFCPGQDAATTKRQIFDGFVKLQLDKKDTFMPVDVANGNTCSTGGYTDRTEYLLCKEIPFFKRFFSVIHRRFDVISTWSRASEKGTHDKHNDSFSNGATHRIILSFNCSGKEMYFSY